MLYRVIVSAALRAYNCRIGQCMSGNKSFCGAFFKKRPFLIYLLDISIEAIGMDADKNKHLRGKENGT